MSFIRRYLINLKILGILCGLLGVFVSGVALLAAFLTPLIGDIGAFAVLVVVLVAIMTAFITVLDML